MRADPVRDGWALLRDGRWAEARARVRGALAEAEAEALEGLSWAAWWLDDAETVFAARERAYRLYRRARRRRRRGAHGDVARRSTSSTSTARRRSASGWLRRAHRLLDPLEPGPDHGWLAFHEGYLAHAAGDTGAARELAGVAAELGRRFGVPDLEMLGLALEGAALVACAQVADGHALPRRGDGDRAGGRAPTIPISGAWTCCFLVTACTAVLDFERAFEWCDRIAEFAERYGSRYMLAFCRAEYGAVDVWRGRWSDAEAMLEASVEDFARSRPAWVGGAARRARRAAPAPGPDGRGARAARPGGRVARAQLCRARLALDRGDAARGDRAARAAAAPGRRPSAGSTACPALELLVHARAGARRARRRGRGARRAARDRARGRHRRAARVRRPGRGRARGRARRSRARAAAARGRRRRVRAQRRAVRGGPRAARARDDPGRAGARRRGAAGGRRRRSTASPRSARPSRPTARDARSPRRTRRTARGLTPREREVLRPARGGPHEPADRRAARRERAHRAPPRDEHPAQARRCPRARRRPRTRSAPASARSQRPPDSPILAYGARRIEPRRTRWQPMWALGDYHRFAKETVWGLGPELGRRLRDRAGPARPRRRRRDRQRRDPRGRGRAPTSSPPT